MTDALHNLLKQLRLSGPAVHLGGARLHEAARQSTLIIA